MPRWRTYLLAALALLGAITACAQASEDPSLFLSDTPSAVILTPTVQPVAVRTPAPTPNLSATKRASIARGGTGSGHPQDAAGLPILVFLDPGHGGVNQGTSGPDDNGQTVAEKVVVLAIAHQTATLLRAEGIGVALSREDDSLVGLQPSDYTADGNLLTPLGVLHDLQGRVNRANASGALVFLSMHMNAFSDPAIGGSETFYDSARPFSDENQHFAELVQSHVITALHNRNVPATDRGVTDDQSLQTEGFGALGVPYNHLIVLGPGVPGRLRPNQIPGALSEPLFLSNPVEAAAVAQADVQALLARAYADAIEEFLRT